MLDKVRGASSLALAVSLIASSSTTALAADLPVTGPEDANQSWTGFYVGGHLGGAIVDWTRKHHLWRSTPVREK